MRSDREGTRLEPLIGARFRVEMDGVSNAAAVEVVFPEARIVTARGKSLVQYGPLILRRGLTTSKDWYQWWDRARGPRRPRELSRTVHVTLIDRFRADVNRWTFPKAVPTAYSLSPLNALASAPLVETLELSVGGFEAVFDLSSSADARR